MSKYRIHSGPVFLWDAESQTVKLLLLLWKLRIWL